MSLQRDTTSMMFVNFAAGGATGRNTALRHGIEDASAVRSLKQSNLITTKALEDALLCPYINTKLMLKLSTVDIPIHQRIEKLRHRADKLLQKKQRLAQRIEHICHVINMDPSNDTDLKKLNETQKTLEAQLMMFKEQEKALAKQQSIRDSRLEQQRLDANVLREQHFEQIFSRIESTFELIISEEQRENFKGIKSIRSALHWFKRHKIKAPMSAAEAIQDPKAYWVLMFHLIAQGVCHV